MNNSKTIKNIKILKNDVFNIKIARLLNGYLNISNLPNNIKKIEINNNFPIKFKNIPNSVKIINYCGYNIIKNDEYTEININIKHFDLPNSITKIKIINNINQNIKSNRHLFNNLNNKLIEIISNNVIKSFPNSIINIDICKNLIYSKNYPNNLMLC